MPSVSTSAFYDRSSLSLSSLRAQAEKLQAEIGSGQRLGAGSDDPVAAARLRGLARGEAFAAIDTTAANRATSDLQLTDSALTSFSDTVIRAQELATQAANGVLSTGQRAGIATELGQIQSELIRLANTRDSTGHALFGGEATGQAYALDASGNAAYVGTTTAGQIALGDGQSVTRGITGPEAFHFTGPGGATNLFAVVKGLADALGGGVADPPQAARDALGSLNAGLETITTAQTVVGARLNWIDLTTTRRTQVSEQQASEQAALGGTDMAETVTRLQQTMTVLEASQASFAKLAGLSLFDLLR
ncbi:MAG: flagellar biosynthesis protein FlgL [Sphingomonadales bacterium]|nr:flagellar biosynthesis protein FlgL [Sphingomonadales bacterium]